MSAFVRATGAYRFTDERHGFAAVQRGELMPANHWSVRQASPGAFADVDVDAATAELVDRRAAALEEINTLDARNKGRAFSQWPPGDQERHNRQERAAERLGEEIRAAVDSTERGRLLGLARAGATEAGDEQRGDTEARASASAPTRTAGNSLVTAARRLINQEHRSGFLASHAAERAESLVLAPNPLEGDTAARWLIATGREAYRTAWAKWLADPQMAPITFTPEEATAFRAVDALQRQQAYEERAMGIGTDAAGGFMVPFQLDPSILLTSAGSVNPLRQISRVVTITSNEWHGISSAGVTAEWKAEHAEAAQAEPVLAQPNIPVHFGDVYVRYSYEVGDDALNFLEELKVVMQDAVDQQQAVAFLKGTGVGQPTGILTALPAGSKVAAATNDVVVPADFPKVQEALPPRFQPNARWLANLSTLNTLGAFETTGGSIRFPELSNGRLLNKPIAEASHLEKAGAVAGAGNDRVALYGDFRHFVIVDRIGTRMEPDPMVKGANGRPTGQRGAFLYYRYGSDVVIDDAFRLLTA